MCLQICVFLFSFTCHYLLVYTEWHLFKHVALFQVHQALQCYRMVALSQMMFQKGFDSGMSRKVKMHFFHSSSHWEKLIEVLITSRCLCAAESNVVISDIPAGGFTCRIFCIKMWNLCEQHRIINKGLCFNEERVEHIHTYAHTYAHTEALWRRRSKNGSKRGSGKGVMILLRRRQSASRYYWAECSEQNASYPLDTKG